MKRSKLLLTNLKVPQEGEMSYIKEPKGVDFVVEPHVLTDEDDKIMSKIIADYKGELQITRYLKSKLDEAFKIWFES